MTRYRQAAHALLAAAGMAACGFPVSAAEPENTPVMAPNAPSMVWVRRPNGAEVARYFPLQAQRAGASGAVMIHCKVTAEGTLGGCVVLGEAPPNLGFGDAGLQLAQYFRMKPAAGETRPMEGAVVDIPLRFSLNGAEGPILNLNQGARAVLVTPSQPNAPERNLFDCPSASDPKRKCQGHLVYVVQGIPLVAMTDILGKAGVDKGTSVVDCRVGEDGSLRDCQMTSAPNPAAAAAAAEWGGRMRVKAQAEDGTPTGNGLVLLEINWAAVKQVRDAIKP